MRDCAGMESIMEIIKEYLPFIIPFFIVQLGLQIFALYHVLTHKKYRFGNRIIWILVVVLGELLGPIIYFTIGRGEE
jgi:carbamoylphosphate synthase small subunit